MRKLFAALCALVLACVSVSAAAATPQAQPAGLADFIDAYVGETGFHGVIRVQERGEVLYHHAVGQADRSFETPMSDQTRFRIASITKIFTSVLILQLQEEGRLHLDDLVALHLPDLPGEVGDRVTLRQLLHHTSGIPQLDNVGSYQEAITNGIPHYQRPMTLAALVAYCCTGSLAAEPGAAFDYNNADYILLTAIIERITGQTWEEALRDRILTPLALNDTGVAHWDAIIERLAPTYTFRDDTQMLTTDMPVYYENWSGAGAMYSTAADLGVFAEALYGGLLLRPESLEQFLTPALDEYGLGLWSYSFERAGRTWHVAKRPGGIMGATGVLYRLLDRDLTIILLSNSNRVDLDLFAQRIANRMIGPSGA